MSPAEKRILAELESKARCPWELNGYRDGLAGRDDRVPEGRQSIRDTYMLGWRDGDRARLMKEAAAEHALANAFAPADILDDSYFLNPN